MASNTKRRSVKTEVLDTPGPELEASLIKLLKFIKMRNASEFSSNLQFGFDLDSCGLKLEDLGFGDWVEPGVFAWETPHNLWLVEKGGQLSLHKTLPIT